MERIIVDILGRLPLEYDVQRAFVHREMQRGVVWKEAGVLVLLEKKSSEGRLLDRYNFVLNKRSAHVEQPGDLCWPGGHPNRWIDTLSSRFILSCLSPLGRGIGFQKAKEKGMEHAKIVAFILANALRETWEEMGLAPWEVDFLGGLPCYQLEFRNKIIYPMVGIISKPARLRTNKEIERIVSLPLASLYDTTRHGTYTVRVSEQVRDLFPEGELVFPCFIVKEDGRRDEILWGATYNILMSFMRAVFDFEPPDQGPVRISGQPYPL